LSPNGRYVATGGETGIKLWDLAQTRLQPRRLVSPVPRETFAQPRLAFSPDGSIVAATVENTATLWRVSDGSVAGVLRGQTGPVNDLVFSPDGSLIYTCGDDGTVRSWSTSSARQRAIVASYKGGVFGIDITSDGKRLAVTPKRSNVRVLDLEHPAAAVALTDRGIRVAFSPSGSNVVATTGKGVEIWRCAACGPFDDVRHYAAEALPRKPFSGRP
jgi:WD40 repeat protein